MRSRDARRSGVSRNGTLTSDTSEDAGGPIAGPRSNPRVSPTIAPVTAATITAGRGIPAVVGEHASEQITAIFAREHEAEERGSLERRGEEDDRQGERSH